MQIHPTAIIESGAEIGANVTIGAYSVIGPHVKIGEGCHIGPHVVVEGHTTIGPECHLSQFSSLGSIPQDLKFKGEPARLILGARNKVREFVTMHVGTASGSMETIIGDNNLFMANSHVAHDCRVGSNNIFANSVALAGHVRLMDNVILGGLVGVHQFCRIGSFVMISAGSMVGDDIAPYCIVQGDRAFLRGINVIGLKRAGMTPDEIAMVKRVYRHFFNTIGHVGEKIQTLPPEFAANPRIKFFVEFLEAKSQRGLCYPSRHASANLDDAE